MTTTRPIDTLTPTQHAILAYALEHTGGKIVWFPDNIKGGARKKVLDGLFNRALITFDGTEWFVAAEGYNALGRARPAPAPLEADPQIEATVAAAEATWAKERAEAEPRTRENSKQAAVIQMLQRPEGATVQQICQTTGWQAPYADVGIRRTRCAAPLPAPSRKSWV